MRAYRGGVWPDSVERIAVFLRASMAEGRLEQVLPGHRGFPSQPTWAANWARRNRCAPNPVESAVAADVTRRAYTNCADDASVELYTIRGGGHTWPGGMDLPEWFVGPTNRSIDASHLMWEFFRRHPRRKSGDGAGSL